MRTRDCYAAGRYTPGQRSHYKRLSCTRRVRARIQRGGRHTTRPKPFSRLINTPAAAHPAHVGTADSHSIPRRSVRSPVVRFRVPFERADVVSRKRTRTRRFRGFGRRTRIGTSIVTGVPIGTYRFGFFVFFFVRGKYTSLSSTFNDRVRP